MWKAKRHAWKFGLGILALLVAFVGCQNDDRFIKTSKSEFFVQDFNPPYLDILWVIDDRSPMLNVKDHLKVQAREFFKRLDQSTAQYRMAITTANSDPHFNPGALHPEGNPVILQKNFGTVDQRALNFSNIIYQVINLKTGPESNGFEAAMAAFTTTFSTAPNVPLVLVFISEADERSKWVNGEDPVTYYANQFALMKGGNKDLVKVYSINYFPLEDGESRTAENRCATLTNADIDKASYEDRYFRMAYEFDGEVADLCGSFANMIDLTGLTLKELPKIFVLEKTPKPDTISVTILRDQEPVTGPAWHFDAASNAVVFEAAPPQGTTILVGYSF